MTGWHRLGVPRLLNLLSLRTECTSTRVGTSPGTPPQLEWPLNRRHVIPRHRGAVKRICLSASNAIRGSRWGSRLQSRTFTETRCDGGETPEGGTRTNGGQSYLEARRRGLVAGRRSLSPTERLERMMGVADSLRESELLSKEEESVGGGDAFDRAESHVGVGRGIGGVNKDVVNPPMVDGEMVLATRENFKRHEYLNRMFPLKTGSNFCSKFGNISHADLVGRPAGKTFTTHLGVDVLIRRPSLEEYVLYMKRTPVISYPKDCCTMLMMIDASPGDVVLDAGTGSGAMTLFLSRAVGQGGCVHSFEAKPQHLRKAVRNARQWATSWNISHPRQPWPENVCFHSGTIQSCHKELDSALADGAIIDMERPHEAMPVLAERLKSGKAAALYIANVTQIVEVVEFLRVHSLPLTIEKTLEVTHRVWVVNQARRHSGISPAETGVDAGADYQSHPSARDVSHYPSSKDNIPKYIARPHNEQPSHSAFLVKVRKIDSARPTYKL